MKKKTTVIILSSILAIGAVAATAAINNRYNTKHQRCNGKAVFAFLFFRSKNCRKCRRGEIKFVIHNVLLEVFTYYTTKKSFLSIAFQKKMKKLPFLFSNGRFCVTI